MKIDNLISEFIIEMGGFAYEMSSLDRVWKLLFPDAEGRWHYLQVIKFKQTYYITDVDGAGGGLEFEPRKAVRVSDYSGIGRFRCESTEKPGVAWESMITAAHRWLGTVRRDWIKANKRVIAEYPLSRRYGLVSSALVRTSLPETYRLDKELGRRKTKKLVDLVENGFFMQAVNTEVPSMTTADYFRYCRIAYLAGQQKGETLDESLTGREMYARYADGRHSGLLDIDADSSQEFADWIDGVHPKYCCGGHPWEIKRGGNTTHINLSVSRPSLYQKEGFKIELRGESLGRMVETMRMLLAIHDAKLPISIANPEGVRQRLLAQDNIGIVPCYASLHRANQRFPQEKHVFDVTYYAELGRYKRRIAPFISWEPLPILKPIG
jgi:hypothetical protein